MTIGNIKRFIKSGAPLTLVLALALVLVPVGASAQQSSDSTAGIYVCNTAGNAGTGGDLAVDPTDPQGALRNSEGLRAKKNTNLNAAMHSRALAVCSAPSSNDEPIEGSGGTTL